MPYYRFFWSEAQRNKWGWLEFQAENERAAELLRQAVSLNTTAKVGQLEPYDPDDTEPLDTFVYDDNGNVIGMKGNAGPICPPGTDGPQ